MTNPKPIFRLTPANLISQRIPCCVTIDHAPCTKRAQFKIYPTCSHSREEWPTVQVCSEHLARAVRVASQRCGQNIVRHHEGVIVKIRPLGTGR